MQQRGLEQSQLYCLQHNECIKQEIGIMRHRIKAGKVGSFTPEKQKVEIEQLENREAADEVEEIFEEDSEFSNDDEALAAMEFYDNPDEME